MSTAPDIKATRPRARRRTADRRPLPDVRHIIMPFAVTSAAKPEPGERISAFLARVGWSFRLPTICVINGEPALRRTWKRRRIKATDTVEFWSRPWGGSGSGGNGTKQVIGIVALVALAAFAPWAGGVLATTFFAGAGASIISSAILIGGGIHIASLRKPQRK